MDPETPVQVLFVDDEPNIIRALRRLVVDEEFETLTANSGEEGLERVAESKNLGLIVSDQRMPGMGGAEFLEKARASVPDTLRIILTGYADLQATMDAINKGGAYRYITKPWDDDELLQVIRDAVARYSLSAENKRLTKLVNQQNEELKDWNANLKKRVLEQTGNIAKKNEELAESNTRLQQVFSHTIHAFSSLIELRDKDVKDHSRNVADLAAGIAQDLGLEKAAINTIRTAALLHDIGKIGIADTVLLKDVEILSPREMESYRQHAVRGQAAIDAIEELRDVGDLIRHHHENFDGSGFPDKLTGNAIPLGARIIAMADYMDRIIKRIRQPNPLAQALDAVGRHMGDLFDPALLPHLKKIAPDVYTSPERLTKNHGMIEKEIPPEDLREGMLVIRDVVSGTGLLLLSKGSILDFSAIKSLRRYYTIDPPEEPLLVLTDL